jgi:uncharacterized protein YbcV (DUF1398 family)
MDAHVAAVALDCTTGSEENRLSFPQVVALLTAAGIESYHADFHRATKTYYLPDGDSLEVPTAPLTAQPAMRFDPTGIEAAVRVAQAGGPGYTYKGFCEQVMAAGCVGYTVSLTGRRAVYVGRTAESHVELFPPAP